MVGGPPSHSAIKERWGPGLAWRGSPRRQSPHRHPNPKPDLEKGRCQQREAPPTPATSPRRTRRRRGRHSADSSLSTERRCRRADGVRQRDPGRSFDHYGFRWFATSHSPSLCLSCKSRTPILFLYKTSRSVTNQIQQLYDIPNFLSQCILLRTEVI